MAADHFTRQTTITTSTMAPIPPSPKAGDTVRVIGGTDKHQSATIIATVMQVDKVGADSVYEPFVHYTPYDTLQELTQSSSFMSEAADSPEKCAEYCTITPECRFFLFDGRLLEAENTCRLLRSQGTQRPSVHYPDLRQVTLP
jgi:hypothetical protein